jgi:hypothetical protein
MQPGSQCPETAGATCPQRFPHENPTHIEREETMTKARQIKKEPKKEPAMNLKEKRAAKKAKKGDAPTSTAINASPSA